MGIRDGLKIRCPLGRGGSNPSSGIRRIRPHSYFVSVVPKMNKMGEDLQLWASERGCVVDWRLILEAMDRITRSDSVTPVEDFSKWCTAQRAWITRRQRCGR